MLSANSFSAKDFYLEPGLPNYFIRGDSFRFQVAAFQHPPGQGADAIPRRRPRGADYSGAGHRPARTQGSAKLPVTGTATATGPVKVRFAGEFQGKQDEVELNLKVHSGLVRDTTSLFGSFTGAREVKLPLPAYLSQAEAGKLNLEEIQAVITLSGTPFTRLARPIRYLLQYPYGCVEQTSSGVLGLAALRGLIQSGHISGVEIGDVDRFIKVGIDRLFTMQIGEGEFGYWPGTATPTPGGPFMRWQL